MRVPRTLQRGEGVVVVNTDKSSFAGLWCHGMVREQEGGGNWRVVGVGVTYSFFCNFFKTSYLN